MMTRIEYADSIRIGSVDFVSPGEIKVMLDIEAPHNLALNTGSPHPFPRINDYLLIPSEKGFIVAQIVWITIERSQYPTRKGLRDFGVIDLPFPLRKISLVPLGMLREITEDSYETKYTFTRGVEIYPTVGDPVLLPFLKQLRSIIESGENRRVKIGINPLAAGADVYVNPDRLFGRHLAILGNTGSGKSCSVAGLIRWSIEAARNNKNCESNDEASKKIINSRFIVLDPNGEYAKTFNGLGNVRIFAVKENNHKKEEENVKDTVEKLRIPLWLWNGEEWCSFVHASRGVQRPILIRALRMLREGNYDNVFAPHKQKIKNFFRIIITQIKIAIDGGFLFSPIDFYKRKDFYNCLLVWRDTLRLDESFNDDETDAINLFIEKVEEMIKKEHGEKYPSFMYSLNTVEELLKRAENVYSILGGKSQDLLPLDADVPKPFKGDDLIDVLEALSFGSEANYVKPMIERIKTLLSDTRMKAITQDSHDLTLEKWLQEYIYAENSDEASITVIDLSLVPSEVIHTITAVIARITLEALQRYRQLYNGKTLPTVIVMEEAHNFIRRYSSTSDDIPSHAVCTKIFEKIAREGRKFGLGMVLSSQRPSELSETVLSQCNSFLLHRISNDRDQDMVRRLVPDTLRDLLNELPSLPSQRAILLGWATELPVLVHMNYLEEQHRPLSQDPMFWKTWITEKSNFRWKEIANIWQKNVEENNS